MASHRYGNLQRMSLGILCEVRRYRSIASLIAVMHILQVLYGIGAQDDVLVSWF